MEPRAQVWVRSRADWKSRVLGLHHTYSVRIRGWGMGGRAELPGTGTSACCLGGPEPTHVGAPGLEMAGAWFGALSRQLPMTLRLARAALEP